MAGFYAVHHGPDGLEAIARRLLSLRAALVAGLEALALPVLPGQGFDTVWLPLPPDQAEVLVAAALAAGFNLHKAEVALASALMS